MKRNKTKLHSVAAVLLAALLAAGCAGKTGNPAAASTGASEAAAAASSAPAVEEAPPESAEEPEDRTQDSSDPGLLESRTGKSYTEVEITDSEGRSADSSGTAEKNYTVMIYMNGSGLESGAGAASEDIREMEEAGIDFNTSNVVLMTGGSSAWQSGIPADRDCILDLSRDPDDRIIAETAGPANMGDAGTLAAFVNYCTERFPARHYGLLFWGTGGGPVWGFGSDELNGGDGLLLSEMREAMDHTVFKSHARLDWVGFDADMMASVENAVLWRDYASCMIASEEVEASCGWNYRFLDILNTAPSAAAFADSAVGSCRAYYDENISALHHPDLTLSAVDLDRLDRVTNALDTLVQPVMEDLRNGRYSDIRACRDRARFFGVSQSESREAGCDLADIADLASAFSDLYPDQADLLYQACEGILLARTANMSGTRGLSVYFPGWNRSLYDACETVSYSSFAPGEAYLSMIQLFMEEASGGDGTDWNLPSLEEAISSEDGYTPVLELSLTPDQASALADASYSILQKTGPGTFRPVLTDVRIPLSRDDTLSVPTDPLLVRASNPYGQMEDPWYFRETVIRGSYVTYKAPDLLLTEDGADSGTEAALITERNGASFTVKTVSRKMESPFPIGRNTADAAGYTAIADAQSTAYTRPADSASPWYTWSSSPHQGQESLGLRNGLALSREPVSSFEGQFLVQLILTDLSGNSHASEAVILPSSSDREEDPAAADTSETADTSVTADTSKTADTSVTADTSKTSDTSGDAAGDKTEDDRNSTDSASAQTGVSQDGASDDQTSSDQTSSEQAPAENSRTANTPEPETDEGTDAASDDAAAGDTLKEEADQDDGTSGENAGQADSTHETDASADEGVSSEQAGQADTAPAVVFTEPTPVDVETSYGSLHFMVSADHAILLSYEGQDSALTIPAEVESIPVTEIGDGESSCIHYVFDADTYTLPDQSSADALAPEMSVPGMLRQLVIPDSVTTIHAHAFEDCISLESVQLPASLQTLEAYAFYGCSSVNAYSISADNTAFKTVSGVLFSADGKTLWLFPAAYDTTGQSLLPASGQSPDSTHVPSDHEALPLYTYTIPEGTVRIADYAFADFDRYYDDLSLVLPSTLETIGRGAFENTAALCQITWNGGLQTIGEDAFRCCSLTELALPDSLRSVGSHAFAGNPLASVPVLPDGLTAVGAGAFDPTVRRPDSSGGHNILSCDTLQIGSAMTDLDPAAFAGILFRSFSVSDSNQDFSSRDGFLMDREGSSLLQCPSGAGPEAAVPEGTVSIESGAFAGVSGLTDLTIPDSVTEISDTAFSEDPKAALPLIFHCSYYSYAAEYAYAHGITVVSE